MKRRNISLSTYFDYYDCYDYIYKKILFQLGPNVTIGAKVTVRAGARIKHAIILDHSEVKVKGYEENICYFIFFNTNLV